MADVPDLLEGIATTRAIRRIRTDVGIPDHDLASIMWHATRAPSGTNRQPARFVVLRDGPDATRGKEILAEGFRRGWSTKTADAGYTSGSALDPTSRKGRQRASMEHLVDNFAAMPVVVLACLVRHRAPNPAEGASIYPACQNLLLAARALGYGGVMTCWHGDVETELHAALGIPDEVGIAATIPLGVPMGHHGPVRRRPLGEVVFDGRWNAPAVWAVDPPGTRFAGGPPATPPRPAT